MSRESRAPSVSGHVGIKEIERLIRKLQLDKEILADEDNETQDQPKRPAPFIGPSEVLPPINAPAQHPESYKQGRGS
jgi:hypothetical protein